MSKTETKARAGTGVSGAGDAADDVKEALSGFMSDITQKLKAQEERLTMLDRKSMNLRRPALSNAVEDGAPHQKAFEAYVRSGDDAALRGLELEGKALNTAVASDGGYLVDPETSATIRSVVASTASLRLIANVVNVEATSYDVLIDHTDVGSGWASETGIASVSRSEVPMALTGAEARMIAERWAAEARVARDAVRLALPMSRRDVGVGDVVEVPGNGLFRLDAIEEGELRICEGIRVEQGVYRPAEYPPVPVSLKPSVAPLPVDAVFLDLPPLTDDGAQVGPYFAAQADPWAGAALYTSLDGASFALETTVATPAVTGVTETPLNAAPHGAWDRGAPLRVRLYSGAVSSSSEAAVFAGANAMAIGTGLDDDWEVFQFRDAVLVAPDVWEVSHRLRGQSGTDASIPAAWPAGSRVVLLDRTLAHVPVASSLLGVERVYRYGPRRRPVDDPAFREDVRAFVGIALRPFAPVHLRARRATPGGDVEVGWVRRTRVGGDGWAASDVPLGEAFERYRVEVRDASGALRRAVEVGTPGWTYSASEQMSDGIGAPFHIDVSQISDRFGPGLARRITINV